jgi:hypothetical protein
MLQRVDARIKKRRSDLTASRGELIEVNVESAFEPIIQETGVLTSPILQDKNRSVFITNFNFIKKLFFINFLLLVTD